MGFGRGKGFTSKVRTEMTSYAIKSGGGMATKTATELTPAFSAEIADVEEQLVSNLSGSMRSGGIIRAAQRLTISNRTVRALSFGLNKYGSPTGDVTFEVRKVSDDSLICSKVWGDALALPAITAWVIAYFDTPQTIDEVVRICVHYDGGDASNYIQFRYQNTDVKADEYLSAMTGVTWTDYATYDIKYRYFYT